MIVNGPRYAPGNRGMKLTAYNTFSHRVAIALWRGNACLWLHRLPTLPPSVDGVV